MRVMYLCLWEYKLDKLLCRELLIRSPANLNAPLPGYGNLAPAHAPPTWHAALAHAQYAETRAADATDAPLVRRLLAQLLTARGCAPPPSQVDGIYRLTQLLPFTFAPAHRQSARSERV